MAYLTEYLNIIRGYIITNKSGEERRLYDSAYYPYNTVKDAIITVMSVLNTSLYPEVNIESELDTINYASWGPDIRAAIYSAAKKLVVAANRTLFISLTAIKYAHYGADMRRALYDIFVLLGAEREDIDPYTPTTVNDYIYTIDNNKATLLYYIGPDNPLIAIPETITVDGSNHIVNKLSSTLFNDNKGVVGVKMPDTVEVIE